jgi:hypothetical protein
LFRVFHLQNQRTEHSLEGFRQIAEWFDGKDWQPAHSAPADMTGIRTRTRMESPIERGAWLTQGCAPFTQISAEILVAFYEHTQRKCPVRANGQIWVMVEGKTLRFEPPTPEFALAPETKVLGYFNPERSALPDAHGWTRRDPRHMGALRLGEARRPRGAGSGQQTFRHGLAHRTTTRAGTGQR